MFNKQGKQPPPIVSKIQNQLADLAAPVPIRRPLVQAVHEQTLAKEQELDLALKRIEELTNELRSFRREEAWIMVNPEFDKLYERLRSLDNKTKAATPALDAGNYIEGKSSGN
jgi:hypothetical protein